MSLWKWRVDQSIASVMALYSEYKWHRIVSLWQDGYKTPTELLAEENLSSTRQGVHMKNYEECGAIGRQEGAGRKTNISAEVMRR